MALSPEPSFRYNPTPDEDDLKSQAVKQAVEDIYFTQLGEKERSSLNEMALAREAKAPKPGPSRAIELMFRRGFINPDKWNTKSKDIIAALVEQQIACLMYHGGVNFASPEGQQILSGIEKNVRELLPKSEVEARAVMDCIQRFDILIQEALKNEDDDAAPELWNEVQEYFTLIDKVLTPAQPGGSEDDRKKDIKQSGIPLGSVTPEESKRRLAVVREQNIAAYKAKLEGRHVPPSEIFTVQFESPLVISRDRREAVLTLLRGHLMGRVRDLLNPSEPDKEERQRKFLEVYQYTQFFNELKKNGMPVHSDWLVDKDLQEKVAGILRTRVVQGEDPRLLETMELGILEGHNVAEDMWKPLLEGAARKEVDENRVFERFGAAMIDVRGPFRSYGEVVEHPPVKEATINSMRAMLEGGDSLPEWLAGISRFDAFVKNRVLEPFAALPDTHGDPVAEAKNDMLVMLPQVAKERNEVEVKKREVENKKAEMERIGLKKDVKQLEDEYKALTQKSEMLTNEIARLKHLYQPAVCETLFAPYLRLSRAELSDTISKTLKNQLKRLISLFENGRDEEFITFRGELLKERGGDTYWQYHIIENVDLLNPRFVEFMERIAVERLTDLASEPAKKAALRNLFVTNNIISDVALLSHGL